MGRMWFCGFLLVCNLKCYLCCMVFGWSGGRGVGWFCGVCGVLVEFGEGSVFFSLSVGFFYF